MVRRQLSTILVAVGKLIFEVRSEFCTFMAATAALLSWVSLSILLYFPSTKQAWLPRWLSGKESTYQRRRCEFNPWVEKEMETHSSILAWSILWKEEPGGL